MQRGLAPVLAPVLTLALALALALLTLTTPVSAEPTWLRSAAAFVETRVLAPAGPDTARPAWPYVARLSHPTDRYDHDVLGGIPPWSMLEVVALACGACRPGSESSRVTLPDTLVFEDVAPRLWDVTGDGRPEIVVVESDLALGARLAVWAYPASGGALVRIATTDFIGTPHRWLAPVGAGDFDRDGRIEIAYVDRPHLVRELVFVRLAGGHLREIARAPGFTAHRIGDTAIASVLRTCSDGRAEVLLPSANWTRLLAVQLADGRVLARDLGAMSVTALRTAGQVPCG